MEKSAGRILTALDAGRISGEEAAAAVEMMREMVEALADLRTGNATVIKDSSHGESVRVWRVQAPDGDEFVVNSRLQGDEQGEARLAVRHEVDDGTRLPGRHRMGVRIDLEKWGSPSVDVQFGESSLDKRIHGLYRNPDGTVFQTPTGRKLADHHFREGLPESMRDPGSFAEMVRGFVEGTMEPLPAAGG